MSPTPEELFARRVRAQRKAAGLTQTALVERVSRLLGTTFNATAITKIETTGRMIRLNEAVVIAHALDVPLSYLVADEDEGALRRLELTRELEWHEARMQELHAEYAQSQRSADEAREALRRLGAEEAD